jgi:hypothetical protein
MAKFKTKGLIFKFETANPPTVVIAQLGDGTLNLGEREGAVDVTTHDNSTGEIDKLDIGFKQPWSFDAEIIFDPGNTGHEALRAAHSSPAGTERGMVILPDTGTAQVVGLVRIKSFTVPVPVKGALKASISVEGMAAGTYTQ